MELFGKVFNASTLYDVIFVNIKSVLTYPTLEALKKENNSLYSYIETIDSLNSEAYYYKNAINCHELLKIVGITYGYIHLENGKPKRVFNEIFNNDEYLNIVTFIDVLTQLSKSPSISLGGYNISNYDLPILIKRLLYYKTIKDDNNKINDIKLPEILKKFLDSKPWDSNIIDTATVWKFNGIDFSKNLELVSFNLNLDNKSKILSNKELSDYYWENCEKDMVGTLNFIKKQSFIINNMSINILKELRNL